MSLHLVSLHFYSTLKLNALPFNFHSFTVFLVFQADYDNIIQSFLMFFFKNLVSLHLVSLHFSSNQNRHWNKLNHALRHHQMVVINYSSTNFYEKYELYEKILCPYSGINFHRMSHRSSYSHILSPAWPVIKSVTANWISKKMTHCYFSTQKRKKRIAIKTPRSGT